jgi:opacity protein-like surface antigen
MKIKYQVGLLSLTVSMSVSAVSVNVLAQTADVSNAAFTAVSTASQAVDVSHKAADLFGSEARVPSIVPSQPSEFNRLAIAQKTDRTTAVAPTTNYWYISGGVGPGFAQDRKVSLETSLIPLPFELSTSLSSKTAWNGNLAVGYQGERGRAELEVSRVSYNLNKKEDSIGLFSIDGASSLTAVVLNTYWNIPTESSIRPYVGVGIGVGIPSYDLNIGSSVGLFAGQVSKTNTKLALQAKAGVEYAVAPKGNVFAEVKYLNVGSQDITLDSSSSVKVDSTGDFSVHFGYRQGF